MKNKKYKIVWFQLAPEQYIIVDTQPTFCKNDVMVCKI